MADDLLNWGLDGDREERLQHMTSKKPANIEKSSVEKGKSDAEKKKALYPGDVWSERLPEVDWTHYSEALDRIYSYLVDHTEAMTSWYLRRKGSKKKWAIFLRFTAILMGILTASTPALIGIIPEGLISINLAPLASVFAAIGAGCVGLDKFFGFSSGWMRFMWAETELQARLKTFQLNWTQEQLNLSGEKLTREKADDLLHYLRSFATDVDEVVHAETRMWVEEFKGGLAGNEKSGSSGSPVSLPGPKQIFRGALKIVLQGADKLDQDAWQIKIGNAPFEERSGYSMVVTELRTGLLPIKFRAQKGGKKLEIEDIVDINAGKASELKIKVGGS